MQSHLKDLEDVIRVQCAEGNWNYDAYMHGLANGLLLAKSLLTGEELEMLEKPAHWGCDKHREGVVQTHETARS